jgi:hypothetical protein
MLKTVTSELRYAHDVISSGETHSARVGAIVDPLLGLFLEGGQVTGAAAESRRLHLEWSAADADLGSIT